MFEISNDIRSFIYFINEILLYHSCAIWNSYYVSLLVTKVLEYYKLNNFQIAY